MKYIILIIVLLFTGYGCNNAEKNQFKKQIIEKYEKEYLEARSQFPVELVDHIPKEFGDNYINHSWSVDSSDEYSIKLFTKIFNKNIIV